MRPYSGTANFKVETDSKLACPCGCGLLPDQDALERLQRARNRTHFGWPITSGARCPEYNSKVSGTGLTGPHTTGRAFDIGVLGMQALEVLEALLAEGFTGIGVSQKGSQRFLHADDLTEQDGFPRPYIWSY